VIEVATNSQTRDYATKATGLTLSNRVRRALLYVVLILLTVIFIGPLFWMLLTSFKTNQGAVQMPPAWIPNPFSTEGYSTIFYSETRTPVARWLANSTVAAGAHTLLILATAAPAAYALARMEFRGKELLFTVIVSTIFVPGLILLMPNYLIVDQLGWLDSIWALIVPEAASAFGVFFLRQFFLSIPHEIEEAARLDGANRFQIFLNIVLPLSKPALTTLAVLSFLNNWNNFLWPVYVLFTPEKLTLPAGLATLQNTYTTEYPVVMAGAVIASVPVLIVFTFAQRFVIQGVAGSAIKG
jgi:multiple sugar transport system permease protein